MYWGQLVGSVAECSDFSERVLVGLDYLTILNYPHELKRQGFYLLTDSYNAHLRESPNWLSSIQLSLVDGSGHSLGEIFPASFLNIWRSS